MNVLHRLSRRLTGAASLLLLSVLTACGSGGGQDPILGVGGDPQLAPTVIATTPLRDATNVPVSTSTITATFSKAMNPATLTTSTFSLACPVGAPQTGAVTYSGKVATLTLTAPLPAFTVCTATVTTGAQDLVGHGLASNYTWTFTTGAPPDNTRPRVIATTPLSDETGVPTNLSTVTATFSEEMNPATLNNASFSLACPSGTPEAGTVSYSGTVATLTLSSALPASTTCTATITTAAQDLAGNSLASNYVWNFTTAGGSDVTPPIVVSMSPGNGACLQTNVSARFSEAMNPATINNSTFRLQLTGPPLGAAIAATVVYDAPDRIATLNPSASLQPSTSYTATVTTGARDLAGNALAVNSVLTFTTGTQPCTPPDPPEPPIGDFVTFGNLSGGAGTTNAGLLTVINGDLGSTATATSAVTGFHDSNGDIYTETTANRGLVTDRIYTCTVSTTGPTAAGVNPASCTKATQARLDAQALFNSLSPGALPGGTDPGAGQLGGLTLTPGVYKAAGGSFMITGSDLVLNGQGNPNARWVFQMASTLTVGAPAAPRNVILINGAQAKNVFWRVGSAATINAAGGGTMVGTILAFSSVSISTVGNVAIVTLNGRAAALNASVTMTNTVINVPAP